MSEAQFFYTTDTPYQWSSGPTFHYYNDTDGKWEEIESLEEAKTLAIANQSGKPGYENYVRTSYGVIYKTPENELEKEKDGSA